MTNFAAIYTCHNRRRKTLASIAALYQAFEAYDDHKNSLSIYMTLDGCTDGTKEAILAKYPKVKLLEGDGKLFWANGMRLAWLEALKSDYDYYLLLNDDTYVYPNLLQQLFKTQAYSLAHYKNEGIYVCGTEDRYEETVTYCGGLVRPTLIFSKKMLYPCGQPQVCDVGTANIMAVSRSTVQKIGIMAKGYQHGFGDYDYTLRANKKKIPVLIAPEICGHCEDDHENPIPGFIKKSIRERRQYLNHPAGLDFKSHYTFVKRFFPWRAPFVWLNAQAKVYIPKNYLFVKSIRKPSARKEELNKETSWASI